MVLKSYLFLFLLMERCEAIKLINCRCGLSNEVGLTETRIYGGTVMRAIEYPWMAFVKIHARGGCAGTIINDLYVVTAAHCLKRRNETDVIVYLYKNNPNIRKGLIYKINKFIFHKGYKTHHSSMLHDIALLRLEKRIKFTRTRTPICLANPESLYTGLNATVVGWGRTEKHKYPVYPSKVEVKIMSDNFCKNSEIGNRLHSPTLCAYNDKKDACQGDSGGPLFYEHTPGKYELIGIVSWGIGCASTAPGVYTKVSNYTQWIQRNTQDATYCFQ